MTNTILHRGPDITGFYLDDWIGMGNTRLSIIDLAGGLQPIHNKDESLWIVYNGEVFNYPELQEILLKRGHTFYTETDTEVVLHLYQEFGTDCLNMLNGQFAFAIWDTRSRELFLARDRVGINPLHYATAGHRLIFGSEIKSILASSYVEPIISPQVLKQIFTLWTPLPGRTIFKDIFEIPPGHYLVAKNDHIKIHQYWQQPLIPVDDQIDWSIPKIVDHLEALLLDAIRIRLRADVPVGAYLSGGLDSSGIVSLITKHFNNDLNTFGIRFEETDFDEGIQQSEVVKYLGLHHSEKKISNYDIYRFFAEVIRYAETPITRTAPVPMYLLSKLVHSNRLKVVLTGEGADEIFGGYNIFRENKVRRFWAQQPHSKWRPSLLKQLYPFIFKDPKSKRALQLLFTKNLTLTDDPFYSHLVRWANSGKNTYYFSNTFCDTLKNYALEDEMRSIVPAGFDKSDAFSKAQFLEMSLFMSHYLLSSQGERMAMAHSVEIRVPYLDHRIIEFMAKVPAKFKIRGMNEKYLLKQVFKSRLPESIVRQQKNPYRAPMSQAFRDLDRDEYFLPEKIKSSGIFDWKKVKLLLQKSKNNEAFSEIESMALTTILSTQIIEEEFVRKHQYLYNLNTGCEPFIFDRRTSVNSEIGIS